MEFRFRIVGNDPLLLGAMAVLLAVSGCGGAVKSALTVSRLVVLHFNDTHSQVLPFKNAKGDLMGGASRRFSYIQSVRSAEPNVLVLQAGDVLTGSIFSSVFLGAFDVELMNSWNQTMSAVGNHEFDYGLANALDLQSKASFPFVAANIYYRVNKKPVFVPYITTNIAGANIVLVGLSTSDEGVYNRNAVSDISLESEFTALSNLLYVRKIKSAGDILFCVTHIGYDVDLKLAAAFPEIDYIIGGHSHTKVEKPVRSGGALVMQTGQWGEFVGRLDLFIQNGRVVSNQYALTPMDSNVPNSPETDRKIADVQAGMKAKMEVKLCDSKLFLDASKIRTEYCPLGGLVADIIAYMAGTPYAAVNAGAIRSSLPSGAVRMSDVYGLCPFDNIIVKVDVKGSDLKLIIQKGVDSLGKGGFLYLSRPFQVTVQGSGGTRTVNAAVDGAPIDDSKTYRVALLDFMYKGGDGYTEFAKASNYENTYQNMRDNLTAYLQKKGVLDASTVDTNARVVWK